MEASIRTNGVQQAACRICGATLQLPGRVMIGEVFDCERCRAPLEVANLEPLVLERFARIEESPEDFLDFDLL